MPEYNHENLVPSFDLEHNNPASIESIKTGTEPNNYVSWENFVEMPGSSNACILYTHSFQSWLAMALCLLTFWAIWLTMFVACTRHYAGQFAPLTSPVAVYGFGTLLMFVSILSPPQTMIFRFGSPLFTYIIGFEGFGIRFHLPLRNIRGLSLIRHQNSPRHGGGSHTSLFVTWKGLGFLAQIGSYVKHDVAIARAEYISARTGLPIIGSKVRITPTPASRQPKGKQTK